MSSGASDAARDDVPVVVDFPGFVEAVEIGRGHVSTVYRAVETDSGRFVALELITSTDPAGLAALERESAALRSVSAHPNIVTLHGVRQAADGRPVLVSELCRGSIAQWLTGRGLPVPDVVTLGVKIAGGLDAAHRAGLAHGTLAAQRILVTAQGEPALSGFALARLRPAGSADVHRAPEALGEATTTPAGDVYALGSVLYELINGRAAFAARDGESPTELADRIRRTPPPPLSRPDVPTALTGLLAAALAKDPAGRPGTAAEFAARLTGVQHAMATGPWPADDVSSPAAPPPSSAGSVGSGGDGWSTPSLVGHRPAEPAQPVASADPMPAPPMPIESDWSAPSIVGRHAAPEPGEPEPEPEPHECSLDEAEPPIEMTRRRPLSTMSPAFGGLPDPAEQVADPPGPDVPQMPDFPQTAEPAAAFETQGKREVETVDPSVVAPLAVEFPAAPATDPSADVGDDRQPDPQPVTDAPEQTRSRPSAGELPPPAEHTLPGPLDPPSEPLVAPATPVQEVAQGEQVRHTQPRPFDGGTTVGAGDSSGTPDEFAEIAVAAPSREPAPDPDALAAALWGSPEPAADPAPPAPVVPPAPAPTVEQLPPVEQPAPVEPPAAVAPPVPVVPTPADMGATAPPPLGVSAGPPNPPPAEPAAGSPARQPASAEPWDAGALAAAVWPPGMGPGSAAHGEESGRYPLAAESEIPTATGPVPTWAFGTAAPAAPSQAAVAAIGDLTLDPASLRRKVTVRSGGSSLTVDETKIVLRQWMRKSEIAWPSVRGFEPRFDGGSPESGGSLVAITDSGPVELPATRRSMADLRYLHALLDAYWQRARSGV